MNGKSDKPYAILVFGAPLSGKTVFAEQFSRRFKAPFVNLTELHDKYHVSYKAAVIMLREFTKCRQTIIVEGGLNTERQRKVVCRILNEAGYQPALVWVQTDLAAIRQRARNKYKDVAIAKQKIDTAYAKIEAPSDHEQPIVISGKHTFQAQCRNVIASLSQRKPL